MAPEVRCATGTIAEIAEALRAEASRAHRRGMLLSRVAALIDPGPPKRRLTYRPSRRRGA